MVAWKDTPHQGPGRVQGESGSGPGRVRGGRTDLGQVRSGSVTGPYSL